MTKITEPREQITTRRGRGRHGSQETRQKIHNPKPCNHTKTHLLSRKALTDYSGVLVDPDLGRRRKSSARGGIKALAKGSTRRGKQDFHGCSITYGTRRDGRLLCMVAVDSSAAAVKSSGKRCD